jgi:osmotically-inducible protein OsmY
MGFVYSDFRNPVFLHLQKIHFMVTKAKGLLAKVFLVLMISFFFLSCGVKDSDIQTAISEKTSTTPELSGVTASVTGGVVSLSGEFKDEASKSVGEAAVKSIKGVKSVVDNARITPPPPPPAPVEISADDQLSKSVADATRAFTGVSGAVHDGVITLTGNIKRSELPRLMKALNSLKPKKIENQLTIK